ncbi:MAG: CPBP family intramembrane metalloprotease [Clostridia bacterium]|nr:CPBP family intramembrane metalloprotease [Clostridia bacterium]
MNELNERFKYLREAIGFYIRLLLCQMGAEVLVLTSSGALTMTAGMSDLEMMEAMFELLAQNSYRMIIVTYLLLSVVLWMRRRRTGNTPLVLVDGLDKSVSGAEAFWGAVMGAGGCLWAAILMELLGGKATPFEAFVANGADVLSANTEPRWLQFVAIVLFSSFFEEYIFRGLIFSRFRRIMSPMGALICQAFVFASMHAGGAASTSAMITGTVMGLVVMKTGSLRGAIAAHAGFTLMSFMASPLYDAIFASPDTTKTIFAASAVVFALGAVFFFRSGTKSASGKS